MKKKNTSKAFSCGFKMTRTNNLLTLLLLIFFSCLVLTPVASLAKAKEKKKKPEPKYEFKIATLIPDGSTYMLTMRALADDLFTQSDGEIYFKFYPGATMGDERDCIRKMRSKQLHGAGFSGMGLGVLVPAARILEMPFTFKTYDEFAAVREVVGPILEDRFLNTERGDFIVLGWGDQGTIQLASSKPIHSLEDLKSSKCWAWEGDALAASIYEHFGLTPIPIPLPSVLTSLQTGILDTIYSSPNMLIQLQWFTKISYIVDVPMVYAIATILLTKESFEKMPPNYQSMVKETAAKYIEDLNRATHVEDEKALKLMLARGTKLCDINPKQRASFDAVGEKIREANIDELWDQEIYDIAMEALAEFRSATAKEAETTE